MEIIKVDGIVIKDIDYKESSKILTILTSKGRLSVIAKGCKAKKSKLRAVCNKFSYGTFNITYRENGPSTLISVDIIDYFKNIMTDISLISYSSYLLELSYWITKDKEAFGLFELLINCLKKINEGLDYVAITNIFEIKALDYLGVLPNINACNICGSVSNIKTISIDKGGYICSDCYINEHIFSSKLIKIVRLFYYADVSKITKLDISEEVKKELDLFINAYYDKYTGLYLNTREFLKNLKKLG